MYFNTELEKVNAFCEEACLNKHTSSWVKRRKEGRIYATIFITRGKIYNDGARQWWAYFVGLEVFARLVFRTHTNPDGSKREYLEGAYPVRLTNTQMVEGRMINADSFSII